MATNLSAQELAYAAAQGVAIALNAETHTGAGTKGAEAEAAILIPNRLIFGGPLVGELFQVNFTQRAGTIQISTPIPAQL